MLPAGRKLFHITLWEIRTKRLSQEVQNSDGVLMLIEALHRRFHFKGESMETAFFVFAWTIILGSLLAYFVRGGGKLGE